MSKLLSIRNQIKRRPNQHYALFVCLGVGFLSLLFRGGWEPFIAAGFVISAIINSNESAEDSEEDEE